MVASIIDGTVRFISRSFAALLGIEVHNRFIVVWLHARLPSALFAVEIPELLCTESRLGGGNRSWR